MSGGSCIQVAIACSVRLERTTLLREMTTTTTSCYNLIIQDRATIPSNRETHVMSPRVPGRPISLPPLPACPPRSNLKKGLFKGTDDHPCLLGAGPPPGGGRFPVFVFPRSLAALRRPGRPLSERSKTLGPMKYEQSSAK